MTWEDQLREIIEGVANVDLYEYQVEVVDLDDGRRQVRYHIAMPATQADDALIEEMKRHGDRHGFPAVAAQVMFFKVREKATRRMRKSIEPLIGGILKAAKRAAKAAG